MAKQKQSRQRSRASRREQYAKQQQQRRLRLWLPIGVVVVAFLGLIAFRLFQPDIPGLVETFNLGRGHDASVTFTPGGLPPTGGTHNPNWANCGIYDVSVDPALAVHSMEHGAVWVTYHPDLPADQVEMLRELARGKSYVLLSPYPDQSNQVAATAWGKQVVADSAADGRIKDFVNRYRGQGPEQGSPCHNGIGTPIEN